MRYFFEVAYNGKNYHGWQIQKNARSVQQVITDCLSVKFRREIAITASGRTDTGVHARKQIFHIDLPGPIDVQNFIHDINGFLPADIVVKSIRRVKKSAHARFDATMRSYEYWLIQRKDPFLTDFAYYKHGDLDFSAMNTATGYLIGNQDFQSFSKAKTDVKNFDCEIYKAEWVQNKNINIFRISANRFLRGMVRAIVGTLLNVGERKQKPQCIQEVINAKSRKSAGRAVPPGGLYLTEVLYPKSLFEV